MNKIPLIENACKDLLQYGMFDAKAKAKYLIKRYLLGRRAAGEDPIFWPTGLLAAGLWHCRQELLAYGEASGVERTKNGVNAETESVERMTGMIGQALTSYYGRWLQKGMPLAVIDDLLAGETLLRIYEEIQKGTSDFGGKLSGTQVRTALDKMAAFAAGHAKDEAGSFFYRPAGGEKTVFVDGIGLAVPFLYQYGALFGERAYQDMALQQIGNFLNCGMDDGTGLPYHGYDTTDGCKYGIIGWGRAVGWLLRGMTGCMTSDHGREKVSSLYTQLIDRTIAFQRQDGCFSWQLQALAGPADTSATGLICAAVRAGMVFGVLSDAKYGRALANGRLTLERSVRDGRVYGCSGECEGFSCYPQRYGAYPWSLAPALEVL